MNGFLNDSNKKIIIGSLGTSGLLAFIYAIRNHYLRLKNRYKKMHLNQTEISSDNLSLKDNENSKQKSDVSEEVIQKIVEKVKNSVIHTTCILIDKEVDSKRQKNEQNTPKSSLIVGETESKIIEDENKNNDDIVITQEENNIVKIREENPKEGEINKSADIADLIATLESKTEFLPEFEKNLFSYNQIRQNEGFMSCKDYLLKLTVTKMTIEYHHHHHYIYIYIN